MKAFSILLLSFSLLLTQPALAAGPEAYFLVKARHSSNLFKRPPEPTTESIQLGVAIEIGNLEVDVTHGFETRDCEYIRTCDWKQATEVEMRWKPGKGRGRGR